MNSNFVKLRDLISHKKGYAFKSKWFKENGSGVIKVKNFTSNSIDISGAFFVDKEIYEKIKLIRSHGRLDTDNYFNDPSSSNYLSLGYNWRMSSITATIGNAAITPPAACPTTTLEMLAIATIRPATINRKA